MKNQQQRQHLQIERVIYKVVKELIHDMLFKQFKFLFDRFNDCC